MRTWTAAFLLAALFGMSAVRADDVSFTPTSLTAQQVLSKAGAARGETAAGTYHRVVSGTAANGDTWQSEMFEKGDDYIETVHDGGFDTESGSYRGTGWDQNENGTVTIDSGFHQSENPFSNVISNVDSAQPAIRVLGITNDPPACVVLELKPKDGLRQLRYYDATTYLLRRVETTEYDGLSYTFSYSDYRTAYGLTYAQHVAYADSHPENAWTETVQAFEPVAANAVSFAVPASRPLFDLVGRDSLAVPADFTDSGIIVRVNVAGRGLDLELDSGASGVVIDSGVVRQLGLRVDDVRKATFGGDYWEGRAHIPDLALGDLHARNVAIAAVPFTSQLGERKIVGLLGGDFFSSARISIDFERHKLLMLGPSPTPPAAPWVAVPIDVDDLVPRAHADFNGIDGSFIVDLGADFALLYPHYFRRFKTDGRGDVIGQLEGVAGQDVDYKEYRSPVFGIGGLQFADVSFMVPQSNRFEDLEYDGLIGRNLLSNFNLIFDYTARKLYMQSLVTN